MLALYNKLKNSCEGIKGDASVDKLGTIWEDAEGDYLRKCQTHNDEYKYHSFSMQNILIKIEQLYLAVTQHLPL